MGQGWSSDLQDEWPELDSEIQLLHPMTHKLFDRFEVKAYGVLGYGDKGSGSKSKTKGAAAAPQTIYPGEKVDAVVVDCAEADFMCANQLRARSVSAASGSIYEWLSIDALPPEVHEHFDFRRNQDAEQRAKYHRYREGQYVIHAVGPVLRDVEQSIRDLTETYANVLAEFCSVLDAPSTPGEAAAPRTLRILPFSTVGLKSVQRLAGHQGRLFWSALAIALERLPTVLQRRLEGAKVEVCIYSSAELPLYQDALKAKRSLLASSSTLKLDKDLGRLPARTKEGYDWVRTANGPGDRLKRLAGASATLQAIWAKGYMLPNGKAVRLQYVDTMLQHTRLRYAEQRLDLSSAPGRVAARMIQLTSEGTVLDHALRLKAEGKQPAAINAASAYHIGGGVMTGGRHALEEAFCMSTTLVKSLQAAQRQQIDEHLAGVGAAGSSAAGIPSLDLHMHIPEDACVVSPVVDVFREGSDQGYAFRETPVQLCAVLSVAMYNRNSRVKDSPMDAPQPLEAYRSGVLKKFQAVLLAAIETGADALVVPDVGCGAFHNDPIEVGSLFGAALREAPLEGRLTDIVLCGSPEFNAAADNAFRGLAPPSKKDFAGGSGRPAGPPRGQAASSAPTASGRPSGDKDGANCAIS